MKKLSLSIVLALVALAVPTQAQPATVVIVPTTAKVDFTSASHAAVIPAGQVNAGQPVVASYQAMVFPVGSSGSATITGPVIAKTLVTTGTAGPFRLTFAQLGITNIPPCTVVAPATCPQYFLILAAIGPGGRTESLAADSDLFGLAPLQPNQPAAAPSVIKVLP